MTPNLTAALTAVEAAWDNREFNAMGVMGTPFNASHAVILDTVGPLLAALRAVRSSGAVVAVVSREAVEALRLARAYRVYPSSAGRDYRPEKADAQDFLACAALANDLADILKETP